MKTNENSVLRVGDVVMWGKGKRNQEEWVVWHKSESRAALTPMSSVGQIDIRMRPDDGKLLFWAKGEVENLSPNSELEVLRSLGRKGLATFIEENKNKKTETMSKNSKSNSSKNTKTEKKPSAGKLGGYKGHSITSCIRAFGKAGWSLDETRAFFEKNDIEVADTTIKIQLRAGRIGEGGDPADFSKNELASMKPKVKSKKEDEAPAKKSKKSKKSKPAPEEDGEGEAEESEEKEGDDEAGEEDAAE